MAYFPKRCVIVPIDFSADSMEALEIGRSLVDAPEHLHVIHVIIDIAPLEAGEVWGVIDPQARVEQVEKLLEEKLTDAKYSSIHTAVLLGEPARHRQLRPGKARRTDRDPIARRTGITRLLIGSVAERVVRLAPAPCWCCTWSRGAASRLPLNTTVWRALAPAHV
jgi:nucleotide-binding universal stress UspA family protein